MRAQLTADKAQTFINGGNATFTLQSLKTGQHYTYKAKKALTGSCTFLSLLTGPNNEDDYTYVGLLVNDRVRLTKKSTLKNDTPAINALNWALSKIKAGVVPSDLAIFHEGRCCRCNRKLTTPQSIEAGIGPECAKHEMN